MLIFAVCAVKTLKAGNHAQGSVQKSAARTLMCESLKKNYQEPPLFSLPDTFNIENVQCPDGYRSIWDGIQSFP